MNTESSIADFFYNLVPGIFFILMIEYFYEFRIYAEFYSGDNDASIVLIYLIGGLFVGFLFQCFTKMLRENFWNRKVFSKVKISNPDEFKKIKEALSIMKDEQNCNYERAFYLMDNYLRGKTSAFLPTHFSSRYAFWANIFWATFMLFLLCFLYKPVNDYRYILIILSGFSIWMADKHLYNFYDSILKTFYMHHPKIKI